MKGILFRPEMIKAIMEGRKTQTRRIIKSKHESGLFQIARYEDKVTEITSLDWNERPKNDCTGDIRPKYRVGEVIYVKEPWSTSFNGKGKVTDKDSWDLIYKVGPTHYYDDDGPVKWKNSMFMPASAARTFLKITNVRVEKLGDITTDDILKEGVGTSFEDFMDSIYARRSFDFWEDKQKSEWKGLWTKINKSYDPDQWLFVYEFKVVDNPKL